MGCQGYTTVAEVTELTGELARTQVAQVPALIAAAGEWLNKAVGRGWDAEATERTESLIVDGQAIEVTRWPVQAVAGVTLRDRFGHVNELADDEWTLDNARGIVWLRRWQGWRWAEVIYTPQPGVPAGVRLAATHLVAHWMEPILNPGMQNVEQYTLPDLSVRFARNRVGQLPGLVEQMVNQLRELYAR